MEVFFLGVGEACDPEEPNTSILLRDDEQRDVFLFDCGFTTPHQYFAVCHDPEELQGIWISHFHGDHFFGLPLFLLKMDELGREKRLCIYGPDGISSKVSAVMEMAYPNCREGFSFELECTALSSGQSKKNGELVLSAASMAHSQNAMAVSVKGMRKKIFYSGDGRPTAASLDLAQGSDLLIHESFTLSEVVPGHCAVDQVVDFARKVGCKRLALVHIHHLVRKKQIDQFEPCLSQLDGLVDYFIPGSGQSIFL